MINRFGESELVELTDTIGAGVINEAILQLAISDAENLIDAKLRGRYTLPIAPAQPALTRIACDLARYFLYDDAAPEQVKDRYAAAMRELRDYATGVSQLDVDTPPPQRPAVVAPVEVFSETLIGTMP